MVWIMLYGIVQIHAESTLYGWVVWWILSIERIHHNFHLIYYNLYILHLCDVCVCVCGWLIVQTIPEMEMSNEGEWLCTVYVCKIEITILPWHSVFHFGLVIWMEQNLCVESSCVAAAVMPRIWVILWPFRLEIILDHPHSTNTHTHTDIEMDADCRN